MDIINNIDNYNLNNVNFEFIKKKNIKYYKINYKTKCKLFYLSLNKIKCKEIVKFNDIYLIKFYISKEYYDFFNKFNNFIIKFISKSDLFKNKVKINQIKNLFFSNILIVDNKYEITIEYKKKNINLFKINKVYNIIINIPGVWIYDDMFGINYIYKK